ncbi:MAG: DUF4918 family protein [Saprospiraceae bacterium]|nr:DUF4918 family protein [Saprospiraceae bacterium]
MSKSFGNKVIEFYKELKDDWDIPQGFETLFPFRESEVMRVMTSFYGKYFSDAGDRIFLYGINPGRFGAGVTGISFTDPAILEQYCDIPNDFKKRHETSSLFIYEVIKNWGGFESFYQHFYITSICPLGFLKDGKNANYYDDRQLEKAVEDKIVKLMWEQIQFGANRQIAFSVGKGTNFKKLKALNDKHGFFENVKPLPHPRWVMQYRRKKMDIFVGQYQNELKKAIRS